MSYLDALLLGLLQGLTEFLPVSSSGHLVLAEGLLGVDQPGVSFEVLVHLGSLLAVLIYFRQRLRLLIRSLYTGGLVEERRWIGYLIVGTIPAGLVGFLFSDFFEQVFDQPIVAAAMLFVTGGILLATRWIRRGGDRPGPVSAVVMGLGQALAIMPGISRSGSTIAFGMFAGVTPSLAAEFSFLLAIPAILGAAVLKSSELAGIFSTLAGPYLLGAAAAFLSGLAAVYWVLAAIKRGRLWWFAYYCFAAGAVGLYLFR